MEGDNRSRFDRQRQMDRGAAIIDGTQDQMRADGYTNLLNKFGTKQDSSTAYQYTQETITNDMDLMRLYESNGLFTKIIDRPAEEAVKHGFDIDYGDKDIEEYIEDRLDALDFEDKFATAEKWARLYGGAIIVMLVNDGRGLEEPLDRNSFVSIEELRVFERAVVQPDYTSLYQFHFFDSMKADQSFGEPEYYQVFSIYGYFTVHRSRCLVFRNGRLPEQTTNANYRYWGIPEYVKLKRALRECITSHEDGVKLLERSVQAIYSMKNLANLLSTDAGEDKVLQRLQIIDMARGILNSIAIDADGESYDYKTLPLSGVKDIIDATCNMLSAVTDIPQTILFGRSPAGENSTGESDFENYYNMVENIQKQNMKKNSRTVIDLILQQGFLEGKIQQIPKYKVKFAALWSMSDSEQASVDQTKAQTEYTKAQTAQLYIDAQVLDPTEVRKALASEGGMEIEEVLSDLDGEPDIPDDTFALGEQTGETISISGIDEPDRGAGNTEEIISLSGIDIGEDEMNPAGQEIISISGMDDGEDAADNDVGNIAENDGTGRIIRIITDDGYELHADGGPGSGNWGHAGRPGKRGGSAGGGGKHNRTGSKESGYSSASKEKAKKKAEAKKAGAKSGGHKEHSVAEGKDVSQTYEGKRDIKSVMEAQGFTGLPKVVSKEEFDSAVQASHFIAQRTYTASSEEIADAYQDQLYNGEWYVECSVGGAQYGQGMYCAADWSGKLTEGIQSEMKHYQLINKKNEAGASRTETLTLDPTAKVIKYEDLKERFYEETDEKTFLSKNIGKEGLTEDEIAIIHREILHDASPEQKKAARKLEKELSDDAYDEIVGKGYKLLEEAKGKCDKIRDMDIGAYAALLGYDAINAEGHGQSGSYTVILNRTKTIILNDRKKHDSEDSGAIRFQVGEDGIIYAIRNRKVIGWVMAFDGADTIENEKTDSTDFQTDGGPGSGNWGHAGRPGKRGGSAAGGGKANRISKQGGGYSSFSKEKARMAIPHKLSWEELYDLPAGGTVYGKLHTGSHPEGSYVKLTKQNDGTFTSPEYPATPFTHDYVSACTESDSKVGLPDSCKWRYQTPTKREPVDGKNILDNYDGPKDIEWITHSQGFDGLPQLVSKAEFENAVKASGIVAMRGYTASSQEILDSYRDQLYNGQWYLKCSGGSTYGTGMYSAAAFNSKSSANEEIEFVAKNYATGKHSYQEKFTMTADANIVDYYSVKNDADNAGYNDVGAYAAACGYDAVRIPDVGYCVVLNRTKCIFLNQTEKHDSADEKEPIRFRIGQNGTIEAVRSGEVIGWVKTLDGISNTGEKKKDAADYEAASVLVISEGRILCAERSDGKGICGPGGHIEEGESPEEAALREAQEEFSIVPLNIVHYGELEGSQGPYHSTKLYFTDQFSGNPEADGDEMLNARWLTIQELRGEKLHPAFEAGLGIFQNVLRKNLTSDRKYVTINMSELDGEKGSGNFGHSGRPGKVGGSSGEGISKTAYDKALKGIKTSDGKTVKAVDPHVYKRGNERKVYPRTIASALKKGTTRDGNTGNRTVYSYNGTDVVFDNDKSMVKTAIYKGKKAKKGDT